MKRVFLLLFLVSVPVFFFAQDKHEFAKSHGARPQFQIVEASIPEIQAAMRQGRITSRELVLQYLVRIALYNKSLNGIITVNRNALRQAEDSIASAPTAMCAARCTEFPSR